MFRRLPSSLNTAPSCNAAPVPCEPPCIVAAVQQAQHKKIEPEPASLGSSSRENHPTDSCSVALLTRLPSPVGSPSEDQQHARCPKLPPQRATRRQAGQGVQTAGAHLHAARSMKPETASAGLARSPNCTLRWRRSRIHLAARPPLTRLTGDRRCWSVRWQPNT